MKVKAKVSFSGILTMSKGQTADLPENETLEDLMNAGYVEAVTSQSASPTAQKLPPQSASPTATPKGGAGKGKKK